MNKYELAEALEEANDLWELKRFFPDRAWIYKRWLVAEHRLEQILAKQNAG